MFCASTSTVIQTKPKFLPASLDIIRISEFIFIEEYLYSSFPGTMAYTCDKVWSTAKLEAKNRNKYDIMGKNYAKGRCQKIAIESQREKSIFWMRKVLIQVLPFELSLIGSYESDIK